jgi:hypothetical protein
MVIRKFFSALAAIASIAIAAPTFAQHAWSDYHWARTTTSFDLSITNSTTSDWDSYVTGAISDWSASSKLNMVEETNGSTSSRIRRQCEGGNGKVRICNLAYGFNGWLGIAGISIDSNGHITTGYTKLNDSYFNTITYDHPEWRRSVACQELGHNVGLGHQDEDFNNTSLFTCMDYQDSPHEFPNQHDYEQLDSIYGHTDTYDSYIGDSVSTDGGGCNAPAGKGCNKSGLPQRNGDIGWGMSVGRRGHSETFMRIDPDGTRHVTHVLWVDDEEEHSH